MKAIILLSVMVLGFSVLTVGELVYLRTKNVDILAHLQVTRTEGRRVKVFFEAVGAVAFVLGQPVLLTALVVWASNHMNPEVMRSMMNFLDFLR